MSQVYIYWNNCKSFWRGKTLYQDSLQYDWQWTISALKTQINIHSQQHSMSLATISLWSICWSWGRAAQCCCGCAPSYLTAPRCWCWGIARLSGPWNMVGDRGWHSPLGSLTFTRNHCVTTIEDWGCVPINIWMTSCSTSDFHLVPERWWNCLVVICKKWGTGWGWISWCSTLIRHRYLWWDWDWLWKVTVTWY